MSTIRKAKRSYRSVGIAWRDPDAVREYNREAQRRWRAKNGGRKLARNRPDTLAYIAVLLA